MDAAIPRTYLVTNAAVVFPDRIERNAAVAVVDGRIAAAPALPDDWSGLPRIDAAGACLAPAYVEFHIHGCGPWLDTDAGALRPMRDFLHAHGVGTFLPTLAWDPAAVARMAAQLAADPELAGSVPGIYLEGPFVSMEKRGGLPPSSIREADPRLLDEILSSGIVRVMTVAPELPGAAGLVGRLEDAGVIPAFGHSACLVGQARAIPVAGSPHLTHLFNAMRGLNHREPGLAALPFLDPGASFELNGDGIHVDPAMIALSVRHLDPDGLILIDDAMVTAGGPWGEARYAGKPIVSNERGCRYRDSGILVGSNCLMDEVARRTVGYTGIDLPLLFRFASLNPARRLGLDHRIGSIEAGKDAHLILLDPELRVLRNLTDYSIA